MIIFMPQLLYSLDRRLGKHQNPSSLGSESWSSIINHVSQSLYWHYHVWTRYNSEMKLPWKSNSDTWKENDQTATLTAIFRTLSQHEDAPRASPSQATTQTFCILVCSMKLHTTLHATSHLTLIAYLHLARYHSCTHAVHATIAKFQWNG